MSTAISSSSRPWLDRLDGETVLFEGPMALITDQRVVVNRIILPAEGITAVRMGNVSLPNSARASWIGFSLVMGFLWAPGPGVLVAIALWFVMPAQVRRYVLRITADGVEWDLFWGSTKHGLEPVREALEQARAAADSLSHPAVS